MPISRQLGLSLFFVLLVVFIGVLWVNVSNTRAFIEQQLSSHAQDTATSLGLSITPYIGAEEDLPIIETMMNAIFDRGYYLLISLEDNEGNLLLEKSNPDSPNNIPRWFTQTFPLKPPTVNSEINNGWNIAGNLMVVSHPGIGYQQLWSNAQKTAIVVLSAFVGAIILLLALVKLITSPILLVAKSSKAISERKFEVIETIPKTPELKSLVESVNHMSVQLKRSFTQLADQAAQYRSYAYQDGLTGVGNRREFMLTLKRYIDDPEHHPEGFLMIVRLSSLGQVNNEFGASIGDEYVTAVCSCLQSSIANTEFTIGLSRINGADFALLIEEMDEEHCKNFGQSIINVLNQIDKNEYSNGTAHIGITHYLSHEPIPHILERADSALANAEGRSERWQIASNIELSQSNESWREQLRSIIASETVDFAEQGIIGQNDERVYSEWFSRFKIPGSDSNIPMSQLLPASFRLNFVVQIDKLVAKKIISKMLMHNDNIGINLSRNSLKDREFQEWFLTLLNDNKGITSRLIVEIPERAIVDKADGLHNFFGALREHQVRITIERFGAQIAAFRHLSEFKPDFLKIDGRFTRDIHNAPDNQLFVRSLIGIAHGLNIKVIAEMVESEKEAQYLLDNGIDFMQGYYFKAPEKITL